ncbi:hypothetical protein F4680DRAFT_99849 [Xylaria scruposa]|nr:hypothetical protein F4680DRAFT_99849 [Xylaria scruposa]
MLGTVFSYRAEEREHPPKTRDQRAIRCDGLYYLVASWATPQLQVPASQQTSPNPRFQSTSIRRMYGLALADMRSSSSTPPFVKGPGDRGSISFEWQRPSAYWLSQVAIARDHTSGQSLSRPRFPELTGSCQLQPSASMLFLARLTVRLVSCVMGVCTWLKGDTQALSGEMLASGSAYDLRSMMPVRFMRDGADQVGSLDALGVWMLSKGVRYNSLSLQPFLIV